MALSTASWHLARLGVSAGATILINGAGTTIGYAAVQIALTRGARVIASAGDTYAKDLRDLGATVTGYGDGLAARVKDLAGGPVDATPSTKTPRRGPTTSATAPSPAAARRASLRCLGLARSGAWAI